MLFFVDESWHTASNGKAKAGVLAAIQVKSHDFNKCSQDLFRIKTEHLGYGSRSLELKGRNLFKAYVFKLEKKGGVRVHQLDLARAVFSYMASLGTIAFASIVLSEQELDLACADTDRLDRPFFFLFERIDTFMKENHPGLIAKIVFDDRGVETNQRISSAVSNFFHRSHAGRSFDSILKVPFFAISRENVGIQVADLVAYVLGSLYTGDRTILEFYKMVKTMEFKSRATWEAPDGQKRSWSGFKEIREVKEKEAGDSGVPTGTQKSIREPASSPPTSHPRV